MHITTDAWTARYTGQNYATLTAHYVSNDFRIESRLVAAKPFEGRKTQERISKGIAITLQKDCGASLDDTASITTDGAADFRAAVRTQTKKEVLHCRAYRLSLALTYATYSGDNKSKNYPPIRKIC